MKKLAIIVLLIFICGCSKNNIERVDNNMESSIKVLINEKEYILNLANNETASSLINLKEKEFIMNELNGNEKYVYLNTSLPTNHYSPKQINKGDVMLYGDNCLVIFYESFNTSYSYTKIGHIDNLDYLGSGSITFKILE